jgi:hypothetical protein
MDFVKWRAHSDVTWTQPFTPQSSFNATAAAISDRVPGCRGLLINKLP